MALSEKVRLLQGCHKFTASCLDGDPHQIRTSTALASSTPAVHQYKTAADQHPPFNSGIPNNHVPTFTPRHFHVDAADAAIEFQYLRSHGLSCTSGISPRKSCCCTSRNGLQCQLDRIRWELSCYNDASEIQSCFDIYISSMFSLFYLGNHRNDWPTVSMLYRRRVRFTIPRATTPDLEFGEGKEQTADDDADTTSRDDIISISPSSRGPSPTSSATPLLQVHSADNNLRQRKPAQVVHASQPTYSHVSALPTS